MTGTGDGEGVGADADLRAMREAYEGPDETIRQICRRFQVTPSALYWQVHRGCWRMRNLGRSADTGPMTARMLKLIGRQLHHLEQEKGPMSDKDIATMGKLAATLETVLQVQGKASDDRKRPQPRQSKEMGELRERLVARIKELKRVSDGR